MAKADGKMKRFFIGALIWLGLLSYIALYWYAAAEHKQARRELVDLKARQRLAQERRDNTARWEREMKEQRLLRQYNRGRVIGADGRTLN